MTPVKWIFSAALVLCLFLPATRAQQGDKKGEVQAARIPKERIPPAPPLPPDEALKSFQVQPGFRVELFASEPMVESPTVMQFDPDGRLWVVEMRGFMPNPDGLGETNPLGRISILEDTDGDHRADRKTIFLDRLVMPRALLLVPGGVLVCEPPQLWFYPNREDRAGERILVAGDFAKDADPQNGARMNPEHSGNSLTWNIDNWIYSLYHPYRYRLRDGKWQREPMPQRAQWGMAQDDFGRLFYTSNSDQLRGDLVPSHYFTAPTTRSKLPGIGIQIARDQSVWPARVNPGVNRGYQAGTLRENGTLAKFTAACGTCVYRGDAFPREFQGNAFICEPSANLIRRNVFTEKDGTLSAHNPYDQGEFLTSRDELFRPVNLASGPDGALYVADMYHGIIQHRFFLTSYLRGQAKDRGLDRVIDKGRIWRIVADRPATGGTVPRLGLLGSADLVEVLAHPNGWWRDTAQRLLIERADAAVTPALQKLATSATNPVTRLHALWTLEGLNQLTPATLGNALADPDARVRTTALRLCEGPLQKPVAAPDWVALRSKVLGLASDTAPEVQIQLAFSLGAIAPEPKSTELLALCSTNATVPLAREAAAFFIEARAPRAAVTVAKAIPLTPEEQKRFEGGKAMYEATCLACHQAHGLGQAGLAPPLVGSEWVSGSEQRLIRIVVHGLRGPIKVKGETFELDMPGLGVLDDDQIAAALTYIRREWGHPYAPISPATVKKVREETEKREDAWTMAELLKIP